MKNTKSFEQIMLETKNNLALDVVYSGNEYHEVFNQTEKNKKSNRLKEVRAAVNELAWKKSAKRI